MYLYLVTLASILKGYHPLCEHKMASSEETNMEEEVHANQSPKTLLSSHHHDHNHHAHFLVQDPVEDDLSAHDSQILIESHSEGHINVRLGFLQVKHVYEVQFSIEDDLGDEVQFDPLQNINVKIDSIRPSEDGKGHDITLTFSAVKEKIVKETITIMSKNQSPKPLTMTLHARVLGKGKGTPSLKKGIHCVRIEWDEESEGSDWQGH
ncbi:hypothetical protein RRG08_031748 [Elysia crispata]|uniref:Adipose-secreted signaling protein n=1 Tax=Elysia crispata TaxID=231223 RepID=A0AAE0ZFZ3_9GAST|nr:hypothetical protein RRG08_031748 [Elysia crispata]